jgi:hypothetical protein
MKARLKTALIAAALGTAAVGLAAGTVVTAGPAAADAEVFATWTTSTCDTATGEWDVTWHLINRSRVSATISDVAIEPADITVVGLPSEVPSGAKVNGRSRIPATSRAHLSFFARWADGTSAINNGYFQTFDTCTTTG